MQVGVLEPAQGGWASGWFHSLDNDAVPFITHNGKFLEFAEVDIPRPDVNEVFGIMDGCGFRFKFSGGVPDGIVKLYSFSAKGVELLYSKVYPIDREPGEYQIMKAIENAAVIAGGAGSVAITCWDGGHNPIGRAKILYDIAAEDHPTMLFAYHFSEFGNGLWEPLSTVRFNYLGIPWQFRHIYHRLLHEFGIIFDTIWMCKPRFPTFLLAGQISHTKTQLILDIDDNEEHFSKSEGSKEKAYGRTSIGHSELLTEQIVARTCASLPLQNKYGGSILRHIRSQQAFEPRRPVTEGIKVGFIGTVRPHKRVAELARALKICQFKLGNEICFHVHGEVAPTKLREDLTSIGTVIGGTVYPESLSDIVNGMDVLITGYPSSDIDESRITEFQITAKIGDALAHGRPVLVPKTGGVLDLADVPGVFLFDEHDLASKLDQAIRFSGKIELPPEFKRDHGRQIFRKQLNVAKRSTRAGDILGTLAFDEMPSRKPQIAQRATKNLLLIWKQHDAGIYGRRIDQIARAFKANNPESNVVVLQLMHDHTQKEYSEKLWSHSSEFNIIAQNVSLVGVGNSYFKSGVEYATIHLKSTDTLEVQMMEFLVGKQFFPSNTVIVIFPVVRFLESFAKLLVGYRIIVDVVDNQFSWQKDSNFMKIAADYFETLLLGIQVIFNSENNRRFFHDKYQEIFLRTPSRTIPNWYAYPPIQGNKTSAFMPNPRIFERFNIVYSGNMNDRLNFDLIRRICKISPKIRVLLIGTANRAADAFYDVLGEGAVYIGAISEEKTVDILRGVELAVMPHVRDVISHFMNPLKVHMYEYFGVKCISTAVEGIDSTCGNLEICDDDDSFLDAVRNQFDMWDMGFKVIRKARLEQRPPNRNMMEYCNLIDAYFPNSK